MVLSARMLRLAGWSLIIPFVISVIWVPVAISFFGFDKYMIDKFMERLSDNTLYRMIFYVYEMFMLVVVIYPYYVFKKYAIERINYSGLNIIINIIMINTALSVVNELLIGYGLLMHYKTLLGYMLYFVLGLQMLRIQDRLMGLGKIITRSVLIASASAIILQAGTLLSGGNEPAMWLTFSLGALAAIGVIVASIAFIIFFFRAYKLELFIASSSKTSVTSTSA